MTKAHSPVGLPLLFHRFVSSHSFLELCSAGHRNNLFTASDLAQVLLGDLLGQAHITLVSSSIHGPPKKLCWSELTQLYLHYLVHKWPTTRPTHAVLNGDDENRQICLITSAKKVMLVRSNSFTCITSFINGKQPVRPMLY